MPSDTPASRYLLYVIAALVLSAAIPDAEVLLSKFRSLQRGSGVVTRTVSVSYR